MKKNLIQFLRQNAQSDNGNTLLINVARLEHVIEKHYIFGDEGVKKAWEAAQQKETDRLLADKRREEEQKRIAADNKVKAAAADVAAKKAVVDKALAELAEAEKNTEQEAKRAAAGPQPASEPPQL